MSGNSFASIVGTSGMEQLRVCNAHIFLYDRVKRPILNITTFGQIQFQCVPCANPSEVTAFEQHIGQDTVSINCFRTCRHSWNTTQLNLLIQLQLSQNAKKQKGMNVNKYHLPFNISARGRFKFN